MAQVASGHATNPSIVKKLPFDIVNPFEPVKITQPVPLVLVVAPSLPAKSVMELIAYGKANPGKLTFPSSGWGGAPPFSGELFKNLACIDMTHQPHKGCSLTHPDLLSGRTCIVFDTFAAIKTQIGANGVRALAVRWRIVIGVLPNPPTMREAGLPGYEISASVASSRRQEHRKPL